MATKPILPRKILINTKHSYQTFRKNHIKVSLSLEINQKVDPTINDGSRLSKLLKIFKTVKYTRKLNLYNLEVSERSRYLPKTIYFAKRVSNTQIFQLSDDHLPRYETKGIFELFPKYVKRIKVLTYGGMDRWGRVRSLLNNLLLRYQPWIKDLSVDSLQNMSYFIQGYCRLQKSPPNLERLFLNKVTFRVPTFPLAPDRLKNLKHLEMKESMVSIIESLPELCPGLQNLGLCSSSLPKIKAFQHLKNLKVHFSSMKTDKFIDVFHNLAQCSLIGLDLKFGIQEGAQLRQVAQLLERQSKLQSLKLQINCEKRFSDLGYYRIVFKAIDELLHLRNLSISITPKRKKSFFSFSALHPVFTKIFTKPIPLESFKLHIEYFSITNQEFLDILKSLQPAAPTLKKLRIDIGTTKLKKKEMQGLSDFLESLQNIHSLELKSLVLSSEFLLKNFTDLVCNFSSLRSLALKEINAESQKQIFAESIQEIFQKRGLEKFHSSVSENLGLLLEQSLQPTTIETILKINPSLVEVSFFTDFIIPDEFKIGKW